jgi:hypothetical protein
MASETKYDIEFITRSLGLLPIGSVAVSLTHIQELEKTDDGGWRLTMRDGESYDLVDEDLAAIERLIKSRQEIARAERKQAIESDVRSQLEAQVKAAAELQGGVQPGGIILGSPRQRFKPQ